MAITYETVKTVTADLYDWSLRRIPEDSKAELRKAIGTETQEHARQTLAFMLDSAETAERTGRFLCSDAGVPSYTVKIGSRARFEGDIRQAFVDGFDDLVRRIEPPMLRFVTNPLTNARSFQGRDMPLVSWEMIGEVDYLDVTCAPKALGGGRWAAIETLVSPSLEEIERCILEMVMRAGGQHCPPVVIGVGIGGTFDHAAKLSKDATLRPFGQRNAEPMVAEMEERLTRAVNMTGFGPMGCGGATTTFGVHVEYAAGHGFTPVAVSFNCWINRRTRARLHNDGSVERVE